MPSPTLGTATRFLVFVAFLAALGGGTGASEPEAAGFILSVHGTWNLGPAPVKVGQAVVPGDQLRLDSKARFDVARDLPWSVSVVLLDGSTQIQSCRTALDCNAGLSVRDPGADNSVAARVLAHLKAAFALIFDNPSRYVSLTSRGTLNTAPLADHVLQLVDGRPRLDDLMQPLAADRYRLRFRPIDPGQPAAAEVVMDVEWNGRMAQPSGASSIGPGLYAVTPLDSTHLGDPAGDSGWILALAAPAFDAARREFEAARARTAGWPAVLSASDRQRFLRAYLASLAAGR